MTSYLPQTPPPPVATPLSLGVLRNCSYKSKYNCSWWQAAFKKVVEGYLVKLVR